MLQETKLTKLNSAKETGTIDKMRKAAHSQGYDMSEPKDTGTGKHFAVDLTHRKTGKKVKPSGGGTLGGSYEKSGALDNTLRNRTAKTIKDHIKSIGRADKRPEAKAARKAQAVANKQRKMRDRDPFTRKPKTFKEWMECYNNETY